MVNIKFTPLLFLFAASASASALPQKRAQCTATLNIAKAVAQRLQSHYYVSSTGMYNGGSLWTDANAVEDLHNLMLATGTNEFAAVADNAYIAQQAKNSNTNWDSVLNGSNDDAGWIILALWKIADWKGSQGQDTSPYLNAASKIYNIVAAEWDTSRCGGGVWWSKAHTYKNAITNELFLYTSADGYNRGFGQAYLDNAKKTWAWLESSGMRNSDGLWNDGLTDSCANNGQETWTYNQGVIASGLAALYRATGNATLLSQAEITLDAAIRLKTQNNILKESCDDAVSGGATCNQDQQLFKGLWTKHLQFYLDRANDAARTAKYSSFLGSQTSAVFHYGTNADNDIGSVWYAPSQGGSVFTPKTSTSGLEAHVAAAKYGPC